MPFMQSTEADAYWSLMALIVQNGSEFTDAAPATYSLEYVAFLPPFDSLYRLTNFEYGWKETEFEQKFRFRRHAALFISWHFFGIFGIPTGDREKFFVREPSWCSDYEKSSLLVATTPMGFAHHSTLVLCVQFRSLFFCIAVAEHYVFALFRFYRLP